MFFMADKKNQKIPANSFRWKIDTTLTVEPGNRDGQLSGKKIQNKLKRRVLAEITGAVAPTKTLPLSYEQYCAMMYPNSTYFGQH